MKLHMVKWREKKKIREVYVIQNVVLYINILYCSSASPLKVPDAQRNAPNNGKEIKFLIHVDILPYYTFKNKNDLLKS